MPVPSTSPSRLRRFAFTVAAGLALVGVLSWYRGHALAPLIFWAVAVPLTTFGALAPTLLAPVQRAWLALGATLAWLNTRVILSVLFYAVVTPIGLIMRLFRDPLDRRWNEQRPTYWIGRPPPTADPKTYERQF